MFSECALISSKTVLFALVGAFGFGLVPCSFLLLFFFSSLDYCFLQNLLLWAASFPFVWFSLLFPFLRLPVLLLVSPSCRYRESLHSLCRNLRILRNYLLILLPGLPLLGCHVVLLHLFFSSLFGGACVGLMRK